MQEEKRTVPSHVSCYITNYIMPSLNENALGILVQHDFLSAHTGLCQIVSVPMPPSMISETRRREKPINKFGTLAATGVVVIEILFGQVELIKIINVWGRVALRDPKRKRKYNFRCPFDTEHGNANERFHEFRRRRPGGRKAVPHGRNPSNPLTWVGLCSVSRN